MLPIAINRSTFETLSRELHGSASEYLRLSRSHLNESLARGYGRGKYASLLAAFKAEGVIRIDAFDNAEFVSRLSDLAGRTTAEAIGVLADGISISVTITKRSNQRQRSYLYSDVAYGTKVEVRSSDGSLIRGSLPFILPTFEKSNGHEPYRVDSTSQFRARVDDGYAVTRFSQGRQLLNAALIDGCWEGGLYVYATEHQINDGHCIPAVKAALVRAILPITSPRVHCAIFRPDRYQFGAWRLELTLGAAARAHLRDSSLTFKFPKLEHRLVIPGDGYRRDIDVGGFVDGVWKADFYSNGIEEENNPTSLDVVRNAYLFQINARLRDAGFT